jgi:HSP20 family protein
MAETDVRKQSSSERSQQSGALERRGAYLPLNPSELFSMSPFALMRRFTDEMDRMFEGLGGRRGSGGELALWSPAVELREHDGKLEVVADLPGIRENDVKLEVTDEGLVIRGERKQEHEEKREGYYRSERRYGQFYRLIPLPENANLEQAHAEFRNGELRVSIPVPERQRRVRELPINTSGERKEPQSQTAGAQQARKTAV